MGIFLPKKKKFKKKLLKVSSQLYLDAQKGERFATINHAQHLKIICGAIKVAAKVL